MVNLNDPDELRAFVREEVRRALGDPRIRATFLEELTRAVRAQADTNSFPRPPRLETKAGSAVPRTEQQAPSERGKEEEGHTP